MAEALTETLVLALLGALLGAALAGAALGPVSAMIPRQLAGVGDVAVGWRVFLFALLTGTGAGLLAGIVPALRASRSAAGGSVLRTRATRHRAGGIVVAGQFALTTVLLVGAGLMGRSLRALYQVDVGVRHEGVTSFGVTFGEASYPTPASVIRAVDDVLDALTARGDVEAAAAISHLPLSGARLSSSVIWEGGLGDHTDRNPSLGIKVVTPGYFDLLGIPVVQGRGFLPSDQDAADPVVVLNSTAAERLWPGEDAIGRWVSYTEEEGQPVRRRVVGVLADVRFAGPLSAPDAEVYEVHRQTTEVWRWFGRSMSFVVRTRAGNLLPLSAAREAVASVDGRVPVVGLTELSGVLDESVARPRFHAALVWLFSALAILLSAIGLHGVTAFNVRRRTQEIGVRMALGAGRVALLTQVLAWALRTALLGGLVGLGAALLLGRTFQSFLWEVEATDPATYAGTVVCLLVIAGIAGLIPARRAARVDPVRSLGAE